MTDGLRTETVRLYIAEASSENKVSSVVLLDQADRVRYESCCVIADRQNSLPPDVDGYRVRLKAFRAALVALDRELAEPREVRLQLISDARYTRRDLETRLEGFERARFVLTSVFEERDNPVLKLLRDGAESLCEAPERGPARELFAHRVLDRIDRQVPKYFELEEEVLTKIIAQANAREVTEQSPELDSKPFVKDEPKSTPDKIR